MLNINQIVIPTESMRIYINHNQTVFIVGLIMDLSIIFVWLLVMFIILYIKKRKIKR